ncbi:MAG: matrixin family metalloprotease [Deltaproteobacteria bacterium]|nr:matrixin family metalloprotease [Deltaproteobacteria bacterium]
MIRIEKAINAFDPTKPTSLEDADSPSGPALTVRTPVTWTYLVINEGNVPIRDITIVDDFGTPDETSDDFTPVSVDDDGNGFNDGDTDTDAVLDAGETWLYTSEGVVNYTVQEGQYRNIAYVTGVYDPNPDEDGITFSVANDDANHHIGQRKGEGNTPGFWKNNVAFHSSVAWPRGTDDNLIWGPYQTLESVFDLPDDLKLKYYDVRLVDALGLGGGQEDALMRHAVAALLNATHPYIAYPLTTRQITEAVNEVLASGDQEKIEDLKDDLDRFNGLESDLNQHGHIQIDEDDKALQAATFPDQPIAADAPTAEMLAPIVDAAMAHWAATGIDTTALEAVTLEIVDLPGLILGQTSGETVLIDVDGAGHGWFFDPTPYDDTEFRRRNGATELIAVPSSPAYGDIDLLTVVMHELGHVLGLEHTEQEGLMDASLDAGVRQLADDYIDADSVEVNEPEDLASLVLMNTAIDEAEAIAPAAAAKHGSSWLTEFLTNGTGKRYNKFILKDDIKIVVLDEDEEND